MKYQLLPEMYTGEQKKHSLLFLIQLCALIEHSDAMYLLNSLDLKYDDANKTCQMKVHYHKLLFNIHKYFALFSINLI